METITMECQIRENKKKVIKLLSAKSAQRVVKVNP